MSQQQFAPSNLWQVTQGARLRYVWAIAAMGLTSLFMFGAPLVGKYCIDVIAALQQEAAVDPAELDEALGQTAVLFHAAESWLPWVPTWVHDGQPVVLYLWLCALAIIVLTAIGGFFAYIRTRNAAMAAEGICRRLRDHLYRHLHALPSTFHDSADTGDLVQRCSSDVETLRVFLASDIVEIGRATMMILIVVPILFSLDADLAVVALMLMPIIFLFALIFFYKVKALFEQVDAAEGAMTAVLQENLTGIRVVRAFARQDFEIDKFAVGNGRFRDLNYRLMKLLGVYWASADVLTMAQTGLVLGLGGYWITTGQTTVGTVFAFVTYVAMVVWPLRQMGRVLSDTGKAVVALGRVNHILATPKETAAQVVPTTAAKGKIDFSDLSFAYGSDPNLSLKNLSFSIEPGATLAIVGPPGSGKSTIIRLLLRLYDYEHGSIQLDGEELSNLDRHFVRSQFGVVLQEPFLYSRSVADNLLVGKPGATAEQMIGATKDAAVHQSISDFLEGYDAMVGERGVTLSGGQRQRVALARALLRDPPILVLDDALSAVDTGTERDILRALERRRGRHTTIVIAHRLTSIMHADRILVLEEGRAMQYGTHDELVQQPGPYRRLCDIQGNLDAEIAGTQTTATQSEQS